LVGTPYPSEIEVSGLGSSISDVNVTVSGLSHPNPDVLGLLLVSPAGKSTILMLGSGGFADVSGINLTFDDAASGTLPDNDLISSGTYKPSVGTRSGPCSSGLPIDRVFQATGGGGPLAPPGPYGSSLSEFNVTNPNSTWKLYLIDESSFPGYSITGWSLDISLDTRGPSVTINQASASGQADPTTDSPIHFTAVFDEPVTGFTGSDVTLSGTAGATTAVVTETTPNDGTTYDVAVSGMSTSGTVIASILANAAQDAGSNGNSASTSTDDTVTFTGTTANEAPTVTVDGGGSCGAASDMRGTINLALLDSDDPPESLTLRATSSNRDVLPNRNISFGGGTDASRTMTVSSLTGSGTSNVTITVSDGDLEGMVLVRVISGSAANNTLTGSENTDMIFVRKDSDTLSAQGANDLMCGGNGNDKLTGGLGADRFGGG
jgi:hypothetical protein